MARNRGILLVLISGLLVMLFLVGAALIGASRLSAAGAQGGLQTTQASLDAESGMHYAASRLAGEHGCPRHSTIPWGTTGARDLL